jgi:TRAP-type C4-dicarboxylate transport system permease small subunit
MNKKEAFDQKEDFWSSMHFILKITIVGIICICLFLVLLFSDPLSWTFPSTIFLVKQ